MGKICIYIFCLSLAILYVWLRRKQIKVDVAHQKSGVTGETYVSRLLSGLPSEYRCLNDLLIRYKGHTLQIDHVIVSPYGVFVVETKNFRGKVYGSFGDRNWLQVMNGKKRQFYSPVRQNYRHVEVISDICGIKTGKVQSVVVFVGRCELHLKDVYNTIPSKELLEYIMKFREYRLVDGDIERICRRLEKRNITSPYLRRCHQVYAQRIKQKYG